MTTEVGAEAGAGAEDDAGAAETSPLEALAQIADLDLRLDQIAHRVAHLPEREDRVACVAQIGALSSEMAALDTQVTALERLQRRHEDEVARIEAKRAQNSARLYDSSLTSPKEAAALSAEAEALQRRQIEVEDQVLDLMEQLEPLGDGLADLERRMAEEVERRDAVDAAIGEGEAEAARERDEVLAERAVLVAAGDQALVSLYEQRRANARGAPVLGRLIGMTCTACHLEVASVDLEHLARLAPDELAECPQCGALLVR